MEHSAPSGYSLTSTEMTAVTFSFVSEPTHSPGRQNNRVHNIVLLVPLILFITFVTPTRFPTVPRSIPQNRKAVLC